MHIAKKVCLVTALALFVCACSNGGDDGVKPENAKALSDANALAKKVDGNFDKLSDSDKQVILKMTNNNVDQAKTLTKLMAHPPNEAFAHKAASPPQSGG
jgi:hypothetical protein